MLVRGTEESCGRYWYGMWDGSWGEKRGNWRWCCGVIGDDVGLGTDLTWP